MMGISHAKSGAAFWLAGCAIAHLAGHTPSLAVCTVGTALCSGWALAPDLDCPNSTVSTAVGPISRAASTGQAWLSIKAYELTATEQDRIRRRQRSADSPSGHRLLSHTGVWAGLCGLVAGAAGAWGGPWAAAVLVFLGSYLGVRTMLPGRWRYVRIRVRATRKSGRRGYVRSSRCLRLSTSLLISGTLAALAYQFTAGSGWWLGVAVGAGSLIHCLGDLVTHSGCPIFAPLRLGRKGEREAWYPVGPPQRLRFTTGGRFETRFVHWLMLLTGTLSVVVLVWT